MKLLRFKWCAGLLLFLATTGALSQELDVPTVDDVNQWAAAPEVAVFAESMAAFVDEYKKELAPLVVPSATKMRIMRGLMEKLMPLFESRIPAEDYEGFVEDVEIALRQDEEALQLYEVMCELRDRIEGEADPERLAALRQEMRENVSRMEKLRKSMDDVSSRSELHKVYRDMFKESPIYKMLENLYDEVVVAPFRLYT